MGFGGAEPYTQSSRTFKGNLISRSTGIKKTAYRRLFLVAMVFHSLPLFGMGVGKGSAQLVIFDSSILNPQDQLNPYFFSGVRAGGFEQHTFYVRNEGGAPAALLGQSGPVVQFPFFGYKGGKFPGIGGSCASSLAPLATCTIVVIADGSFVEVATSDAYQAAVAIVCPTQSGPTACGSSPFPLEAYAVYGTPCFFLNGKITIPYDDGKSQTSTSRELLGMFCA